jgi:hypothetical protein
MELELATIIRKYVIDKGWHTKGDAAEGSRGYDHAFRAVPPVVLRDLALEADESWRGVLIKAKGAMAYFCKMKIDFHDPTAFEELDKYLEVCSKSQCNNCPIKNLWLMVRR